MTDPIAAISGSDLEWFTATEGNFCGGCGDEVAKCHPDKPCGDVPSQFDPFGYGKGVCDLCPTRLATGEIDALRSSR